ncbi:EF-hand domain-containing protein [Actibacterium sp. XHP0104]|uniref:EF-hand domain-containing protein n=1 Tax=Actibacterium sp. XHP0104 TaxID=2984335 RepID=UPI0021E8FDC2|nr:EF-hand domain-containing protein [Actibacterium sp. XHP0104]MCV2880888.1 EF-hand domain-containing protein [Actibacterium sp. XHP0104]
MNKMIAMFAAALTVAGAATASEEGVVQIDSDADGVFSIEELTVAYPELSAETFAALDANADGSVDEAELAAGQEAGLLPDAAMKE